MIVHVSSPRRPILAPVAALYLAVLGALLVSLTLPGDAAVDNRLVDDSATAAYGGVAPWSLEGHVLMATSKMPDPRFVGTSIYILFHSPEDGALGLVLNDRREEDGDFNGGPVDPSRLFVLHSSEYLVPSTVLVGADVALTVGQGREHLLDDEKHGNGPAAIALYHGYSGWGPMQLETELSLGVWDVRHALPSELLFPDTVAAATMTRCVDK